MNTKKNQINTKLFELGKNLDLNENDVIKAKRTIKNIAALALFTGIIIVLGNFIMTGGPAGLYYTGVSIKDFKLIFGGLI